MTTEFCLIPTKALQAGSFQPRLDFCPQSLQELAQSIASHGLIEPLVVRLIAKNVYEIIAGERRWRAAQLVGLEELPCLVGDYTDKQACALTLIENVQREDLNLIEEAGAYKRLIDEFHYQQDEIAVLVGKSRSHIANILRLLQLSPLVKQNISKKLLSLGHARLLVGLEVYQQEWLAEKVIQEQCSVREFEKMIKAQKVPLKPAANAFQSDKDIMRLQTLLAEQIGSPVQIVSENQQGGWLKIQFFDNDTLAGLLERFGLGYD